MGYVFLLLTIVAESTAVIFMKYAEGFTNRWFAIAGIIAYILGFLFLTLALKILPLGATNAIWAGASTVIVAIAGIYFFREQLSVVQWVSISLIILGIAGLQLGGCAGNAK